MRVSGGCPSGFGPNANVSLGVVCFAAVSVTCGERDRPAEEQIRETPRGFIRKRQKADKPAGRPALDPSPAGESNSLSQHSPTHLFGSQNGLLLPTRVVTLQHSHPAG